MNYKEIITNVAKTLDPGLAFNVTIVTNEDLGEAHFVVADIEYPDVEYTIPFIIYNETCIFMPADWSGQLPLISDYLCCCKWVSFPEQNPAHIIFGLPRIFV